MFVTYAIEIPALEALVVIYIYILMLIIGRITTFIKKKKKKKDCIKSKYLEYVLL